MILIDTSAFIEFLNHTGSREDRMIEQLIKNNDEVGLPDIALTEILQGIKDDREHVEIKKSLLTFPIFSLKDKSSFITAADLYRKCRKEGHTIRSTIDLLIAQIAIENEAPLIHRDKDYDVIADISDLKIYKK